jgi:hypothetical protein
MRRPTVLLALAVSLAAPSAPVGSSPPDEIRFDDGETHALGASSPLHRSETSVVVANGSRLLLAGVDLRGTVRVAAGSAIETVAPSKVHTLVATGDAVVTGGARLEVLRLIARDDAVVGGSALDLTRPEVPKTSEEELEAWLEWRLQQAPFLQVHDRAQVSLRNVQDDPVGVDSILSVEAAVETTGVADGMELVMRGDATFTADVMTGGGELFDRSHVEIVGGNRWGSFDLRDDATAHVRHVGDSTGAFSIRMYDRSSAIVEDMADGALWNRGTGLLTVRDSVAPPGFDYQRELRIFMEHPDSRVVLERFGGEWSLNTPVCGANCNPFYLVIGRGKYLRAEDSLFHMERTYVEHLELRDSRALTLYPTSPEGQQPIRGDCLLAVGTSATNLGHADVCSRLRVRVVGTTGAAVEGARVTLLDAEGDPVPVYDVSTGVESATRTTDALGGAVFDFAPRARPVTVRVQGDGWEQSASVIAVHPEHDVVVAQSR